MDYKFIHFIWLLIRLNIYLFSKFRILLNKLYLTSFKKDIEVQNKTNYYEGRIMKRLFLRATLLILYAGSCFSWVVTENGCFPELGDSADACYFHNHKEEMDLLRETIRDSSVLNNPPPTESNGEIVRIFYWNLGHNWHIGNSAAIKHKSLIADFERHIKKLKHKPDLYVFTGVNPEQDKKMLSELCRKIKGIGTTHDAFADRGCSITSKPDIRHAALNRQIVISSSISIIVAENKCEDPVIDRSCNVKQIEARNIQRTSIQDIFANYYSFQYKTAASGYWIDFAIIDTFDDHDFSMSYYFSEADYKDIWSQCHQTFKRIMNKRLKSNSAMVTLLHAPRPVTKSQLSKDLALRLNIKDERLNDLSPAKNRLALEYAYLTRMNPEQSARSLWLGSYPKATRQAILSMKQIVLNFTSSKTMIDDTLQHPLYSEKAAEWGSEFQHYSPFSPSLLTIKFDTHYLTEVDRKSSENEK